jgi:hypothetical protein
MSLRAVPSENGLNSPPFQQQSHHVGRPALARLVTPCSLNIAENQKIKSGSRTWTVGCGGEVIFALIVTEWTRIAGWVWLHSIQGRLRHAMAHRHLLMSGVRHIHPAGSQ